MINEPDKLCQTDVVSGLWSEFISWPVHAAMHSYKSLRTAVMIFCHRG